MPEETTEKTDENVKKKVDVKNVVLRWKVTGGSTVEHTCKGAAEAKKYGAGVVRAAAGIGANFEMIPTVVDLEREAARLKPRTRLRKTPDAAKKKKVTKKKS